MTNATPPLRDRVASTTNAVLKIASEAGAQDVVERITLEAQLWSRPDVTVVVAGESQVGKSSVVNSLLGRSVLPVGEAELGAGRRFSVVRGGVDGALVHVGDAHEPQAVALDELHEWLGGAAASGRAVRGADIQVESSVLGDGLVLVDTPALGSVDDAESRITRSVLGSADAVLFVADAGRPLSSTAMAFLEGAVERIDTVVVALTKIDRFRGWRDVAADDRRAIARSVDALHHAALVPVSNRLKTMADELAAAGTPDAQLEEESGVRRLLDELRSRIIDRKHALRLANLLRVDLGALAELDRRLGLQVDADAAPSAVQAQVDVDQAELEDFRVRAEQSQIVVADGFAALRDSATTEANLSFRELSGRLEARARERGAPPLLEIADLELRAVDAQLSEHVEDGARRLVGMVDELLGSSLAFGAAPTGTLDLSGAKGSSGGASGSDDLAARMRVSVAGTVASSGTGIALFASRVATPSGPTVLLALFGATATIGMVVAGLNLRMMKRQADIQTVRREIQSIVETVRTASGPAIRQRVLATQREVEAAMRSEVRARTRGLQQAIADGTRLAKADAAERQRAAAAATTRRAEVERVRGLVGALVAEVSAG